MKTKTTYPAKAKKAKVLFVAALVLMQASLIASDSSNANLEYLNEEAFEAEYEIENWMSNVHANAFDTQAVEEEMELEEWMSNIHTYSTQAEEEIELEEWMYNTQHSFWLDLNDAEELELSIENWMSKPNEWMTTSDELILSLK